MTEQKDDLAPAEIWAMRELGSDDMDAGTFCSVDDGGTKYIRADLAEAAEAKLAVALVEKQDAIDTLKAWFDLRKLAHDTVDQAVINAVSGYLRTSRVGGMSQKESDLVLGVIQDMAHLSVFADLFARATLAKIKGEKP